jgi:hypothetical protein
VVERPHALAEGVEWTIKMHPPRMPSWQSISESRNATAAAVALRYETRNADGNPSYVKWAWEVVGAGTGAKITVTWDCYLKMLDRRFWEGRCKSARLPASGTDDPPVTAA